MTIEDIELMSGIHQKKENRMIVELCGVPGAGKSTLLNKLISKNQSVKVYTREDVYDRRKIERTIRYFIAKFIGVGPDIKLYKIIKTLSQQYPSCTERYEKRLFGLIIVLKCSRDKLIILEEGLIQYVSSIAYEEELSINEAFNDMMSIIRTFEKYKIVFCDLDTEECIARIKKRNKEGDRYNLEDYTRITKLLELKKGNIKRVIESMHISEACILEINTKETLDENVKKLQQFVFSR